MNKKVIYLDNLSKQMFKTFVPIPESASLKSKAVSFWNHHHRPEPYPTTSRFIHQDGSVCELTDVKNSFNENPVYNPLNVGINDFVRGGEYIHGRPHDSARSTSRSRPRHRR